MPEPIAALRFNSLESLAYANGKPELEATLKQSCSDFLVEEQIGFEFTGQGEHLYLQIAKTDRSTIDVARRLSEVSGVPRAAIGYSGMKDRRAETSQWFSIKLPAEQETSLAGFETSDLKIIESGRNSRKLKIGSHRSNRFRIVLRGCIGERSDFEARLAHIERLGVPNYFGTQRFGRDLSNLHQVQDWMHAVLNGGDAGSIGRQRFKRGMLFSAARSYLFNELLSARVEQGSWDSYLEGDVLNLDGTERCFALKSAGEWDAELQRRLDTFDIHITGPLPGEIDSKDKYVSYGKAADIEDAVCKQYATLLEGLRHFGVKATRRPLRFRPSELKWHWQTEPNTGKNKNEGEATGGQTENLILEFSLARGVYATSLLRELCVTREHGQ